MRIRSLEVVTEDRQGRDVAADATPEPVRDDPRGRGRPGGRAAGRLGGRGERGPLDGAAPARPANRPRADTSTAPAGTRTRSAGTASRASSAIPRQASHRSPPTGAWSSGAVHADDGDVEAAGRVGGEVDPAVADQQLGGEGGHLRAVGEARADHAADAVDARARDAVLAAGPRHRVAEILVRRDPHQQGGALGRGGATGRALGRGVGGERAGREQLEAGLGVGRALEARVGQGPGRGRDGAREARGLREQVAHDRPAPPRLPEAVAVQERRAAVAPDHHARLHDPGAPAQAARRTVPGGVRAVGRRGRDHVGQPLHGRVRHQEVAALVPGPREGRGHRLVERHARREAQRQRHRAASRDADPLDRRGAGVAHARAHAGSPRSPVARKPPSTARVRPVT